MPHIYLETVIAALPKIVFDLSRSVDIHKASMTHHNEEIIAGVKTGLMNMGDTVTWRAKHLFVNRTLKVKITEMSSGYFCDEMVKGDFKRMKHQHYFQQKGDGTLMIDQFYFDSPLGIVGKLVDHLFLKQYMTRLLKERNQEIKRIAESGKAQLFLAQTIAS